MQAGLEKFRAQELRELWEIVRQLEQFPKKRKNPCLYMYYIRQGKGISFLLGKKIHSTNREFLSTDENAGREGILRIF